MKQYIARLLFPVPLSCELLLLGLIFLWFSRWQRLGKVLVSIGLAILLLASNGSFGNLLLGPIESTYAPLDTNALAGADVPRWIVVLGAGYAPDPNVPLTSRPSPSTLVRFLEGIRLQRLLPGSKLVVSVEHPAAVADFQELSRTLGVATDDVVLLPGARDTVDEAVLVQKEIGNAPFILVSSAAHMPRAVETFRAQGLEPRPAPTMYTIRPELGYQYWYPSVGALQRSERAIYEYLGSGWHWLTH